MILYDETIVLDEGGGSNDANSMDINATLKKLEESIARLNQNLEKSTEISTEDVATEEITEEISTEEIPEEEMPVQKKDIDSLKESVEGVSKSVDNLASQEKSRAEMSTQSSGLVYLDETVDSHLYLTSQVENATMNDLYTMTLSIRNVAVLALLIFLSLGLFKLVRTGLERMLNR